MPAFLLTPLPNVDARALDALPGATQQVAWGVQMSELNSVESQYSQDLSPIVEISRGVISWTSPEARPHEEEMRANPLYEAEQTPTLTPRRWFFGVQ